MTLLRRFKSLSQTTNPSINVAVEQILILLDFVAILLDGLFYSHVFLGLLFLSVITTCMIWGDLLLCLAFHPSSSWPNFHSGNQCKYWAFLKVGDLSKTSSFYSISSSCKKTWGSKAILLESWRPNGRSDQTQAPAPRWTWKTNGIQGAAASNDGNEDCWELVAALAAPHLFLQVRNSYFIFSCEFSTCSMVQVTSILASSTLAFLVYFLPLSVRRLASVLPQPLRNQLDEIEPWTEQAPHSEIQPFFSYMQELYNMSRSQLFVIPKRFMSKLSAPCKSQDSSLWKI